MKRRMIMFTVAVVLLFAGIGPAAGEGGWMETEKSMDIWQSIAGALLDVGDIISGAVEQAGDEVSSVAETASETLAEAADNLPAIWEDLSGLLESAGEDAGEDGQAGSGRIFRPAIQEKGDGKEQNSQTDSPKKNSAGKELPAIRHVDLFLFVKKFHLFSVDGRDACIHRMLLGKGDEHVGRRRRGYWT